MLRYDVRWKLFVGCLVVAGLGVASWGCEDSTPPAGPGGSGPTAGAKLGDDCSPERECRDGLACTDGTCQPAADKEEGAACSISGECGDGLYCEPTGGPGQGTCQPAGEQQKGEACGSLSDCAAGLRCTPKGIGGVCEEAGDGDVSQSCDNHSDCRAGLGCTTDPQGGGEKLCRAGQAGLPRLFPGVTCDSNDAENPRAYFEVPGTDGASDEFYRLPFPNDIRLKNGRPDLTGHPTPGSEALGFDIVQTYLDAIGRDQQGWGTSHAMYFRFSVPIDFKTVSASGDNRTLRILNLTEPLGGFSLNWKFNSGRTTYMCQNTLSVKTGLGGLRPKSTYALVLFKGIESSDGDPIRADDDFKSMLTDSKPSGAIGDAWEAYEPLRAWIGEQEMVKTDDILSAAVFTTGDPRAAMAEKLRSPARATVPTTDGLTLCKEGVDSPCDDGLEGEEHRRGCFGERDDLHEIQGTISLPVFQKGEPPYLEKDGDIGVEGGAPKVQRREDVCMTMTVPKKAQMPDEGWPLVLYAPGTGGHARSVVNDVASLVTDATAADGMGGQVDVPMMTMAWEQVQHFRRRGDTELGPERLVFNYANPKAARGNFLQGAADIYAVTAWAEGLEISAGDSPTGETIKVDPSRIYFVGHSQGGTTGPLALPYEPNIGATVLSGAGAGLIHSLLGKTQPENVPAAVALALHERQGVDSWHPVLHLLQAYFEPVDPMVHARYVAADRIDGVTTPHHTFHIFGVGDTFTPPDALEKMARELRARYIPGYKLPDDRSLKETTLPASGTVTIDETPYTLVGRQYEPDAYDGHFVMFRNTEAQDDVVEFLGTAAAQETPVIAD